MGSAVDDLEAIHEKLNTLYSDDNEKDNVERDMIRRCFAEVSRAWPAIHDVAQALLSRETGLKQRDVDAICKKYGLEPQVWNFV